MCIIAIDFDGVLTDEWFLKLAKKLVKEKNEVFIVTMRSDNEFNNKRIEPILRELQLTKYNVVYCNKKPKLEMLEMINADVYIDNIDAEFHNILRNTNIIPLLYNNS